MILRWIFLTSLTLSLSSLHAANAAANDAQNDSTDAPHDKPLVKWTFDDPVIGTWQGKPKVEAKGPQPPVFPSFTKGNKAAFFSGKDSSLTVKENDLPGVNLRFKQGEALTIEAWVNVEDLKDGKFIYLIGKGRNKNKDFALENQNYALRLKGDRGKAHACFLFRSESEKPDSDKDYHRWTSDEGFTPNSGWHHVAVSYTFGEADSIAGYVDGKKVKGTWDMGGKSDKPPVNDADDLMIGTGNGGGAANSFHGWLDEVAIWREALPAAVLAQRYQFVPPTPVVDVKKLPKNKVLVQICEEGVPSENAWPQEPRVTESYEERAFGIFEVPHKYVDTGVRGDRASPYLLRAAANVTLPSGKHRLLLRGHSVSHLYVDGKLLLKTGLITADGTGHGHVKEQDKFLDLGSDFRFAPPGTQETWGEFELNGGEHLVVIEQIIGGAMGKSQRRPETGEMVVAISYQGSESWELLAACKEHISYTDAGWTAYESERRQHLDELNAQHRSAQRAQHADYWEKRRAAAQQWLALRPEVKVPELPHGFAANNEIDHFIAAKIVNVSVQNKASQSAGVDFFREVQPILEAKCYDCHRGAKVKGGLKLDSLAEAQKGGKQDGSAVQPGKPDESALLKRVSSKDEDEIMPPKGERLNVEQIALLTKWIKEGAQWPEMKPENVTMTALCDDLTFLRRVYLDTVGVVPSLDEVITFTNDASKEKRSAVIERLLQDKRWADHWMGYWQDVLAENPNILNPTLNNTGPFRWWIYESVLDDKPMDLFVTELLRMKGSERLGGPAGFGIASQNDVPMAAKGTIVSTAFLGVEMKCARCHDSPSHKSKQEELFSLAAMLATKPIEVPKTSSVAADKLTSGGRKPLIEVTLKPGTKVEPRWPFTEFCDESCGALAEDAGDSRDRLAALITTPHNERFAQVLANRVWARFMGRGIVEPVADWEKGKATHPELLQWLGREFVRSGYSFKHLARIILNSQAYQRATDAKLHEPSQLYIAPAPRRLAAEQIVDSLFVATGKPFKVEEVSLDIDGRRDLASSISLGQPSRCWMLTSTSNERDRPSLALPRIQAVTDVLAAFGWRGSRQDATTKRETDSTAIQPAIMSNGTMSIWLTRLSDDHGITQLALQDKPLDSFLDTLFLKLLTRKPTAEEKMRYTEHLRVGYEDRIQKSKSEIPNEPMPSSSERRPARYVSWSNHLDPEATIVRQEQELAARRGDTPTTRLDSAWRQRLEDVLWALLNAPEWVFAP